MCGSIAGLAMVEDAAVMGDAEREVDGDDGHDDIGVVVLGDCGGPVI